MRICIPACLVLFTGVVPVATAAEEKKVVTRSEYITLTGHNCPCPEDRASYGSRCGKRSNVRKGGYSVICSGAKLIALPKFWTEPLK